MLPPAFSSQPDSPEARKFEQYLQEAILAIKRGDRALGKRLLDQAALINPADSRVWIWLSATTDDPQERYKYLESAVASDPTNATAKRGLSMLRDQLDKSRLVAKEEAHVFHTPPAPEREVNVLHTAPAPEREAIIPQVTPPAPERETHVFQAAPAVEEQANIPPKEPAAEGAVIKTYTCPNCGALISYDVNDLHLVCKFCGFTRKVDEQTLEESMEQVLDEDLPSTPAHHWAQSQSRLTCEQCGAVLLLPPGQTADSCPYCASNRFAGTATLMEIIDPQAIGRFKLDPEKAARNVKSWLGKGLFSPDDLALRHAGMQLHPAYFPFWLFSGTLEIPWFCDINTGTGQVAQWEADTGLQVEQFDNILIPGLRKMSPQELVELNPFTLDELVEFSPEHLAGWTALAYDNPLADASMKARDEITKKVQPTMSARVESSRNKRNFRVGVGKWSGLTYKLALLPLYVGNYPFQGKRYRLLINGQTGKVAGNKPIDKLKVALFVAVGIVLFIIIIQIFILLGKSIAG